MNNLPKKGLFGIYDISTGMYVTLILLLILIYICIFHKKYIPKGTEKLSDYVLNKCLSNCSDENQCKIYNSMRGKNYWIGANVGKDLDSECRVTAWEIIHLAFHVLLGYFYNIYVSQGISFGFEAFEAVFYDCGSVLDLGYNFVGFIIGHGLKVYTST
jgi:hypothetical protein